MTICVHPLDELCAFLGAVGLLMAFWGLSIGIGQLIIDKERYKTPNDIPSFLYLALVGAGIMILVLILGWINTKLPANCTSY